MGAGRRAGERLAMLRDEHLNTVERLWLRVLKLTIERDELQRRLAEEQAQVERLRAALHELQAEASTLTVWLNKTKVTTTLNLDGAAIEARRVLAETAGAAE